MYNWNIHLKFIHFNTFLLHKHFYANQGLIFFSFLCIDRSLDTIQYFMNRLYNFTKASRLQRNPETQVLVVRAMRTLYIMYSVRFQFFCVFITPYTLRIYVALLQIYNFIFQDQCFSSAAYLITIKYRLCLQIFFCRCVFD